MTRPSPHDTGRRPAILVGYGPFGLEALRRLLADAALRGALDWVDPEGGASPAERTLRDLALLWIPEVVGAPEQDPAEDDATRGTSLEILRDLYQQIRTVDLRSLDSTAAAASLSEALLRESERLLSASSRGGREAHNLPLGLDVVVLARPTRPEVVGTLNQLLEPGMRQLAGNSILIRAVQGSDRLSFLQILDFEHYWSPVPDAQRLRRAVQESVRYWERVGADRKPAFRRIYLVDGQTEDGTRDALHRLEEVSLFLELLLFEGQRDNLQQLFLPHNSSDSPLATFSVRLLERGTGLLLHLAAARFGEGWLPFLAGEGDRAVDPPPPDLARALERYRPEALDGLLGGDDLRAEVGGTLEKLEEDLLAIPFESDDWPRQARRQVDEHLGRLRASITERAARRMDRVNRERLDDLAEEISAAISRDLHHPEHPSSLGVVSREIGKALDALKTDSTPARTHEPEEEDLFAQWGKLHARYRRFRTQRVNAGALRRWWPLYSVMLAVILAPSALDLFEEALAFLPKPDPVTSSRAWILGHDLLMHLARPSAVGLMVLIGAAAAGGLLYRFAAGRIARTLRFFNDPQQGRLVDRLRAGLVPGGAIHVEAERFVGGLLRDMALSVHSEVRRELEAFQAKLRERQREILWLRDQLREFLKVHGRRPDAETFGEGRARRPEIGIRDTVEGTDDLDRVLAADPPTEDRFRSAQSSLRPFKGWNERYCDAFLYPLTFLGRLSKRYPDPFQRELAHPGEGPEQKAWVQELLTFLRQRSSLHLAFEGKEGKGVPNDERYCLLPSVWSRLEGVQQQLRDQGIPKDRELAGRDAARVYLLRIRAGVDPDCLVKTA